MADKKKKWFSTGKDGEERSQQMAEESAKNAEGQRFWLKPGTSTKIIFLDSEMFYIHEHNLFMNNRWNNFFTCLQDFDNCPLCEAGHKAYYCAICTIIDTSEYQSKRLNRVVKNQRKLLVLKQKALAKLKKRRDSEKVGGDLTLAVFEVARGTGEDPSSGDDWDFLKTLDAKQLRSLAPKELKTKEEIAAWMTPFDYEELMAPKSADQLRKLVGIAAPVGHSSDKAKDDDDDEPKSKKGSAKKKDNDDDDDDSGSEDGADDLKKFL